MRMLYSFSEFNVIITTIKHSSVESMINWGCQFDAKWEEVNALLTTVSVVAERYEHWVGEDTADFGWGNTTTLRVVHRSNDDKLDGR